MASLQTLVKPNRRAAARFVAQTRRRLQRALAEHTDISRAKIADALDVHRSVITRHFNGTQDMTMGRAAELAWALGYEPEFVLHDRRRQGSFNEALEDCPAFPHQDHDIGKRIEDLDSVTVVDEFELA